MGRWLRPSLLTPFFNRNRDINPSMSCPWTLDCSSHVWTDKNGVQTKRAVSLKPKLRLVEQIQPLVGKYKCGYCGLITLITKDKGNMEEGRKSFLQNPSLMGGRKTFGKEGVVDIRGNECLQ